MICAGVTLCVAGAASGELGRVDGGSLFSASGVALGYLIIFGSLVGYSTHEWLLHHASSQLAGTYAFASPLVAVILGWWLLGERIGALTLVAAGAISIGVALVIVHPQKSPEVPEEPGGQAQKLPAER
jgi:drug/metabolite transporter (DMT)-like permease